MNVFRKHVILFHEHTPYRIFSLDRSARLPYSIHSAAGEDGVDLRNSGDGNPMKTGQTTRSDPAQIAFCELLSGCIDSHPNAWRDFATRYHRLITGCAVRFGSHAHAEDVAQTVYLQLIQNHSALLRRFAGPEGAFIIYLKSIARNTALNYGRKERRRLADPVCCEFLPDPGSMGLPEFPITPTELLEEIMALPMPYRIVLHLRFAGYNHREIATILDRPLNTVLTQSSRAISRLKSRLLTQ